MFIIINSPLQEADVRSAFDVVAPFFGVPDLPLQLALTLHCQLEFDCQLRFGKLYQDLVMFCERSLHIEDGDLCQLQKQPSPTINHQYTQQLYYLLTGILTSYMRQPYLMNIISWIRSQGKTLNIVHCDHSIKQPYLVCELN